MQRERGPWRSARRGPGPVRASWSAPRGCEAALGRAGQRDWRDGDAGAVRVNPSAPPGAGATLLQYRRRRPREAGASACRSRKPAPARPEHHAAAVTLTVGGAPAARAAWAWGPASAAGGSRPPTHRRVPQAGPPAGAAVEDLAAPRVVERWGAAKQPLEIRPAQGRSGRNCSPGDQTPPRPRGWADARREQGEKRPLVRLPPDHELPRGSHVEEAARAGGGREGPSPARRGLRVELAGVLRAIGGIGQVERTREPEETSAAARARLQICSRQWLGHFRCLSRV